jgi:hypothetical protein
MLTPVVAGRRKEPSMRAKFLEQGKQKKLDAAALCKEPTAQSLDSPRGIPFGTVL